MNTEQKYMNSLISMVSEHCNALVSFKSMSSRIRPVTWWEDRRKFSGFRLEVSFVYRNCEKFSAMKKISLIADYYHCEIIESATDLTIKVYQNGNGMVLERVTPKSSYGFTASRSQVEYLSSMFLGMLGDVADAVYEREKDL